MKNRVAIINSHFFITCSGKENFNFLPRNEIEITNDKIKTVNFKKLKCEEIKPGRIFSAKSNIVQAKRDIFKISLSNL